MALLPGPQSAGTREATSGSGEMRSERQSSVPRIFGGAGLSRRNAESSGEQAHQAGSKRTVRLKTNWSALFRRIKPSQQTSSIARSLQMRTHNSTDLATAALEVLVALMTTIQLALTFKAPFWRQNRACELRDDCTIDLSDGSFRLPNIVRMVIFVLGITRAWIRIRFLLKVPKGGRPPSRREFLGKLLLEILSVVFIPFPGVEEAVGRHASGVFLLLTFSVAVRPIFWRQLLYFPYPIRQKEKVASFSGNLEFSYRSFVFKKVMDDSPLTKIIMTVVLLSAFGSYVIHVTETIDGPCRWPAASTNTPVTSSSAVCDEMSDLESFWLLSTTIVPIGFGDVVPRTTTGRTVVVLIAVISVGLNAMFFSTIIRKFSFSSMEARVHTFLYRMELYGKKDLSAVLAVQATFRFHKSYERSLIWHQQMRSNVLYRPLSARLPNEVKKKLNISRFQASLKDIMKYDTDGDPLNAFVKHIEVITAALGTAFVDIARLKTIANRHSDVLAGRRSKQLRPTFMAATAFGVSPHDTTSTLVAPIARIGGASTTLAPPGAVSSGVEALSLPSRVEEPRPVEEQHSPTQPLQPEVPSSPINNGNGNAGGIPASWGEQMLRRCELTLAILRRIEEDARDIL